MISRYDEFMNNCFIIDLETTDLNYDIAEVIELGYSYKTDAGWTYESHLYSATSPVTPEVSWINNITQKMVADKPNFMQGIHVDLNPLLEKYVGVGNLVAHNAFYDRHVIKKYPLTDLQNPWLCTYKIANKLYGEDKSILNFKLAYLRYKFDLPIPEDMPTHRAGADTYMTAMLLEYLVKEMEKRGILNQDSPYNEQIDTWVNAPVIFDVMPIGKYKGVKLTDIPLSYYEWALDNMDRLKEGHPEYDVNFSMSVAIALEQIIG